MVKNPYQQAFIERVVKTSKALEVLNAKGCAVLALNIDDSGNTIEILPPPKNALNGVQTTIKHDTKGRHYHMMARVNGCNVRWQENQFN